ncbi:MAG TPA: hypothetical protein VM912_23210 [Terriglobales bacterium]|nr:hypothetical protein [Terriglobales bacterium]
MSNRGPQVTPHTPDPACSPNLNRDPEDRRPADPESIREKMMDKTLARLISLQRRTLFHSRSGGRRLAGVVINEPVTV